MRELNFIERIISNIRNMLTPRKILEKRDKKIKKQMCVSNKASGMCVEGERCKTCVWGQR